MSKKLVVSCLELDQDTCREKVLEVSKKAEETSTSIKLVKNKIKYHLEFENDICIEVGYRSLNDSQ